MTDAQRVIDIATEEYLAIVRKNILESAIYKEKAERLEAENDNLRAQVDTLSGRVNVLEEERKASANSVSEN